MPNSFFTTQQGTIQAMKFDTQTILLLAGAAVALFFPQLKTFAQKLTSSSEEKDTPRRTAQSRAVGSEPADWIVDLLHLKKVLDANGQTEASSLISQAATKIIGADTPRNSGGKR